MRHAIGKTLFYLVIQSTICHRSVVRKTVFAGVVTLIAALLTLSALSWSKSTVKRDFDRLYIGMTIREVREVLHEYKENPNPQPGTTDAAHYLRSNRAVDDYTILIIFDNEERVVEKVLLDWSVRDPSLFERVIGELGLRR